MIYKIISPALGYLLVAFACELAGYFSNPDRTAINSSELILSVFLLGGLFPVYINRAILYDQKRQSTERNGQLHPETRVIQDNRIGLSVFTLVLIAILYLLLIFCTDLKLPTGNASRLIITLRLVIALSPSYVFGFWNNRWWQKDTRCFDFRYRSFFPALATCILPFIYGWGGPQELFSMTVASLLLVAAWGVSLRMRVFRLSLLLFVLFSGLVIVSVVTRVNATSIPIPFVGFVQVFSFGVLMTLVMGVSESWRVATRIRDDVEYGPPGVYDEADKTLYLAGTNLAASVFLPFFLVTFLHPSTTFMYLGGVIVLLCAQYLLWFSYAAEWNQEEKGVKS